MKMTINNKMPTADDMYAALVRKDSTFEGVFIAAIKTTGIFCRSSCTARKPKFENVEFFQNVQQALSYGYRPCKVCQPMKPIGEPFDDIKSLLKELASDPELRLKDWDLKQRGFDPTKIRRWFKKHHMMTFQAYSRALRINHAYGLIRHTKEAKNILGVAMDSGFDSISGFNDAFKKISGSIPSHSKTQNVISITRINTPLGPMFAAAGDKGLCLLEFTDRRMLETQIKRLTKLCNAHFVPGNHPVFKLLDEQLSKYFQGNLKNFSIPLDTPGTAFQQQVWQQLTTIPYGETRSYQQQAEAINNIKAVRAVAKTNGDNRISIIIPCHRVIGKNGKLTGYGGGIWRKQRLLELESAQLSFTND